MRPVAVFLRAINVGGRKLAMSEFRQTLAQIGHPEARTLQAAGNAVISAMAADGALEARIEAALAEAHGLAIEVFARDGRQLAAILADNPWPDAARDDPARLAVVFLKGEAGAVEVDDLRGRIVGRETVAAGPGCLYARYPDGQGESKLTPVLIERALKLRGTARNWNTLGKMAELTRP